MEYDVIIIGGGPAGLAAGLYAGRDKLNTLLIERGGFGGQLATTTEIKNYPGAQNVTGPELTAIMKAQCEEFDVNFAFDDVQSVSKEEKFFIIKTRNEEYKAKSVILATGTRPALLGIKGEKEFTGLGVSYCATCDGAFFKDLDVFVVGGGDTALKEAVYLTKFAKTVTVVHRRNKFRASKYWVDKAGENKQIKYLLDSVVTEIKGEGMVQEVCVQNVKTGETAAHKTDGVFMFVGLNPNTEFINDYIEVDEKGYVITNESLQSTVAGLFAAGDVRQKNLRQVITATADGAITAKEAEEFVEVMFGDK